MNAPFQNPFDNTAAAEDAWHWRLLAQLISDIRAEGSVSRRLQLRLTELAGELDLSGLALNQDPSPVGPERLPIAVAGEAVGALEWEGPGLAERPDNDATLVLLVAELLGLSLVKDGLAGQAADQQGMHVDLAAAAEIQRKLLPDAPAGSFPVFGLNRPARTVSGDFFDYFSRADGIIPFALGDVSGKGIDAALLMVKTASLFRCLARSITDPAELLTRLNAEVYETASRGKFVTMVAGLYDPKNGRVCFANAGHEPPLFRDRDRRYQSFEADEPPLGILSDIDFQPTEICLDGGELYIFSDGLTEFCYGGQEQLGADGLMHLLESMPERAAAERVEAMLQSLDGAGWEARDDLTVLTIDDGWTPGKQ